jgi:hypothetical protein
VYDFVEVFGGLSASFGHVWDSGQSQKKIGFGSHSPPVVTLLGPLEYSSSYLMMSIYFNLQCES